MNIQRLSGSVAAVGSERLLSSASSPIPFFFFATPALLETAYGIPIAEAVIAVAEGTVLAALYGFKDWRRMYQASFVMNAFSYGVSLLLR